MIISLKLLSFLSTIINYRRVKFSLVACHTMHRNNNHNNNNNNNNIRFLLYMKKISCVTLNASYKTMAYINNMTHMTYKIFASYYLYPRKR